MTIDQTLAKGLTKSLFDKWDGKMEERLKSLSKEIIKINLNKRNNYEKFFTGYINACKDTSINYFVGGAKRNPYIANITMVIGKNKVYKTWTERSLTGALEIQHPKLFPALSNANGLGFYIGEHAITRVFQRAYSMDKLEIIDPFSINIFLKYVPIWTSFWLILLQRLAAESFPGIEYIEPVIPAPKGFFLCKTTDISNDGTTRVIELRTYIHSSTFTPHQAKLHKILLQASEPFVESIMTIYPHRISCYDKSYYAIMIFYEMILEKIFCQIADLGEIVLLRKGDFERYKFEEAVQKSRIPNIDYDLFERLIKTEGIRATTNLIEDQMELWLNKTGL